MSSQNALGEGFTSMTREEDSRQPETNSYVSDAIVKSILANPTHFRLNTKEIVRIDGQTHGDSHTTTVTFIGSIDVPYGAIMHALMKDKQSIMTVRNMEE